ncbi:hypothetical protein DMC30DRAFT_416137 [Rhodotorula diobovata]|uniref:Dolichol phosphate-mannose biosynthesis regulatory protein n=1 Tax=Rhodotorula diobovata TaxID=5288 RepID=A0A5C5FWN3_9BASI|nr:hypothetical protein DMC30DRAFT_416137 [Rhodotorula diobovata]
MARDDLECISILQTACKLSTRALNRFPRRLCRGAPSPRLSDSETTVRRAGLLLLVSAFAYYTLWTLVTRLFPLSREWAIRLPALVLLSGLSFVAALTGFVLVETARGNRTAARRRSEGKKGD